VSRAGSQSHDVRLLFQTYRSQPIDYLFSGLGAHEEIRGRSIRLDTKITSRREVSLSNRTPVAVPVPLRPDQPCPGEPMLGVGSPPARHEETQCPASQIVVQIQQVSVLVRPELRSKAEKRSVRRQAEHEIHIRIMAEQRHVLALRKDRDPGSRMSVPDGSQQRRGEEDVSDGAETNRENVRKGRGVGHGPNGKRSTVNGKPEDGTGLWPAPSLFTVHRSPPYV
jgi:hypothetical protein